MSEHYRIICGEKTRPALAHLRRSGRRWTYGAPFGFSWVDGAVAPDLAEQPVIEQARELRGGGLSLRRISAALAAASMLGRTGRPLSAETVSAILRTVTP